ncbi:F-box/kelch-repeat protein [Forsythia ovata]|uniref:F-box/kelch-repeat protein n=1 Tax=Forsythia ovata TaxID=205694 RepID=A0ABD1PJE8_9LAMI
MELIPCLPYDVGLECLIRVPYEDFSSFASVCTTWKHQIQLPEFWRRRGASKSTQRVVVMAQARVDPTQKLGTIKYSATPAYRLTVFEPERGYWTELPPVPGYSDGLPMFCQLVGVGLNLVVMGGLNPVTWEVSNSVYIYNFISATWRRGTHMPGCQRSFFACASDSNRTVFVAGGHDSEKCALKSAMAYDVTNDKWTHLPDMARERDESKGIFHLGKFHVIGGYSTNTQGRFEASAGSFNISTWQWDSVCENFLEIAMCPRHCLDRGDGTLYISRSIDVSARKGSTSTWQVVTELPVDVQNIAYMTGWQDKLLVIGSPRFGAPHRAYLLDTKTHKWEENEVLEAFSGHVQSGCYLEL